MEENAHVSKIAAAAARGVGRERTLDFRRRVGASTDRFKVEAANRVEGLATQLRELGDRFDRPHEANSLARRFERTADYLRYRPAGEVAADAWQGLRDSGALWLLGGLAAGLVLYRVTRNGR